jgi:hypothetical protein
MGWIKTFGLGVVIFSMIFIAFFSLFQTMDSGYDYASGFNYSNSELVGLVNESTNMELESSFNNTGGQAESFQNGTSLTSGSAYDNLIASGYSVITSVWNYPIQAYHLATSIMGGVLGISREEYKWLYDGLSTLFVLLILFAILAIIFRSDI